MHYSFREDENLITFANLNKNKSLKLSIKDMRGINKEMKKLYEPNEKGMFKCLTNNQFIDFDKLNDDYCDCLDESDEPSTNACQFGKFYCSFQDELLLNYHIPSSRVDDKICDCCDGSDEKPESKCINICDNLILKLKNQAKERSTGLTEKKKYLTNDINVDENLYGPEGVFSKLKKKCYNISSSENLYKVCPYRKITQRRSKEIICIGRVPSLVKKNSNHWILKMNGGDNYHNKPRASEINLMCGSTDEITSVQEPQKNFFVFSIKTPDACL
ncbi:unnamed protein product [Brachionus calyciflorus]|uniref:MRH domain-containing protein n=1 Tax=Brachionus calyciflorus TaxID=104777 RepID=A0A814JR50_9BILA|nr:unnamed protein product [Brachionus calyciflorus]